MTQVLVLKLAVAGAELVLQVMILLVQCLQVGMWTFQLDMNVLEACDGAREHVLGPCGSFHTPTKMCRYFMVNRCWRAKVCTFAHSSLELDDSARYEEIMADFRFDGTSVV